MSYRTLKTTAVATLLVAAGTVQAEPATYKIDPTHTFVTFEAQHFGTSTNRGRFDQTEGEVKLDRKATTGSADITIHTGSISTGTSGFDGHLRGKRFFNAEQYPTATFKGSDFVFDKNGKIQAVKGDFTLLGKTLGVTIKAKHFNCYEHPYIKREVCGGDFETTIQRSRWGMDYGVAKGLPDDIRLVIQIEAIKQ